MVVNYKQHLRAAFSCFHGQKFNFLKKSYISASAVKKISKNFGKIFFGLKTAFLGLAASCFGYIVKGVCLLLLPLVSVCTAK